MARFVSLCLLAAAIISSLTAPANAVVAISIFNTGVDDNGLLLPDNAVDPHYTLLQVPGGSGLGSTAYAVDSTKFPLSGSWMPNSASSLSKWIAPQADQSTFLDLTGKGYYTYRTTFDLTGLNPSTAVINGRWSTDNFGILILLNGASTGFTHIAEPPSTFSYFSSFTINTGFISGINTLDFLVNNPSLAVSPPLDAINPTGLRVELTGTALLPEPSSIILCVSTMTLVLARFTRKR